MHSGIQTWNHEDKYDMRVATCLQLHQYMHTYIYICTRTHAYRHLQMLTCL